MARRARGAGAVFQRADGRWEAQLRIGPSRRRSLYAQTRPDVVARLDRARWSMAPGIASQNASHQDGDRDGANLDRHPHTDVHWSRRPPENGCINMRMRSDRASLLHPPSAAGPRQPICSARATMMPAGPRR
jgi:hypothetical protein